MRMVLDTNVVVAAMRSPRGASARLIERIALGHAQMLLSMELALEYDAVCLRQEHLEAARLSMNEARQFLNWLSANAVEVKPRFRWRPQTNDPSDEMVLETAVNGRADALVTYNRRHLAAPAMRFGVSVASPGEAIIWSAT